MIVGKLHVKLLTGLLALGMAAVTSGCARSFLTYDTTNLVVGLSRDSDATDPNIDPSKKPKEINSVIASQSELHLALDALREAAGGPPARLSDLLETIRAENNRAPNGLKSFRGLGGVFTQALISAANKKKDANGEYDPNNDVSVTLSGLITGYTFDLTNNSGNLLVDTTVDTEVNGVVTESVNYVWNIRINPNGYRVVDHSGVYEDPFRDTLVFGEAMLERVDEKKFNKKLWAYGAGSIHIISVIRNGTRVPPGDPLLIAGPDSCIDMMFKVPPGGQIPTNLAELQEHSYCLGRCKHPVIINSK